MFNTPEHTSVERGRWRLFTFAPGQVKISTYLKISDSFDRFDFLTDLIDLIDLIDLTKIEKKNITKLHYRLADIEKCSHFSYFTKF